MVDLQLDPQNREEPSYLNISKFSKLVNVSRRTLIYYDSIGLLKPAKIEGNGYRFYTYDQVDLVDAIKTLSEMGVPLSKMKEFLDSRTPLSARQLLMQQKALIEERVEHYSFVLEMIESKIQAIDEGVVAELSIPSDDGTCSERQLPVLVTTVESDIPIYLVLEGASKDGFDFGANLDYYKSLPELGIPLGFPFGYVTPLSELKQGGDLSTATGVYLRMKSEAHANAAIPAGRYMIAYDHAEYGRTEEVIASMLRTAEEEEYEIVGDSYEEYLINELSTHDKHAYLVKVMIPICGSEKE